MMPANPPFIEIGLDPLDSYDEMPLPARPSFCFSPSGPFFWKVGEPFDISHHVPGAKGIVVAHRIEYYQIAKGVSKITVWCEAA